MKIKNNDLRGISEEDAYKKVAWCWEKDEIAWTISFYDGTTSISKVKMTGDRWLIRNSGYEPIYQYEVILSSGRYPHCNIGKISHTPEDNLYETLEEVKELAKEYRERYIKRVLSTIEENKKELNNFYNSIDKRRLDKLKRICQ